MQADSSAPKRWMAVIFSVAVFYTLPGHCRSTNGFGKLESSTALPSSFRRSPPRLTSRSWPVSQDKASNSPRPLPANGQSFLQTDGSGISLITWKAAEDGDGTILRLAETTGKPVNATVRFLHRKVISAILCSGVEDSRAPRTVQNQGGHPSFELSFKPYQVLTVKLISE